MERRNDKKIQHIKQRLIAKKEYILSQLKKFASKNIKVKNGFRTKFLRLGDHKDENAIESSDNESALSVKRDFEEELKNVGDALKKTSKGDYEKCSICGKQIDPRRLEIMPEATLCVECSEKKK